MHRIIKAIFIFILTVYCCLGVVTILHWGMNVCTFHFATFTKSEIIPTVYGLPDWDMLMKANDDKIILGGCMVHFLSGVCPYCHWPTDFTFNRDWHDEPMENN